ncbi:hypothetical protein ONZ45_g17492 [Pleurotus djamor]|nr:hypothetical protein ONZ45_g17492 [Pleurotus djamor]
MRFATFIAAAFLLAGGVIAADSEKAVIDADFSKGFEDALLQEFGPVTVEGLKSKGCNPLTCGLSIAKAVPCIVDCLANGEGVDCVAKCIPLKKLCSCFNCLPKKVKEKLHKIGICKEKKRLELFTKVYLETASDDEVKEAEASFDIKKDTLTL